MTAAVSYEHSTSVSRGVWFKRYYYESMSAAWQVATRKCVSTKMGEIVKRADDEDRTRRSSHHNSVCVCVSVALCVSVGVCLYVCLSVRLRVIDDMILMRAS